MTLDSITKEIERYKQKNKESKEEDTKEWFTRVSSVELSSNWIFREDDAETEWLMEGDLARAQLNRRSRSEWRTPWELYVDTLMDQIIELRSRAELSAREREILLKYLSELDGVIWVKNWKKMASMPMVIDVRPSGDHLY